MKSKKVLTILLSLAIMLTFMPTFAFADEVPANTPDGLTYYVTGDATAYDNLADALESNHLKEGVTVTASGTATAKVTATIDEEFDFTLDFSAANLAKDIELTPGKDRCLVESDKVFSYHSAHNFTNADAVANEDDPTCAIATVYCENGDYVLEDVEAKRQTEKETTITYYATTVEGFDVEWTVDKEAIPTTYELDDNSVDYIQDNTGLAIKDEEGKVQFYANYFIKKGSVKEKAVDENGDPINLPGTITKKTVTQEANTKRRGVSTYEVEFTLPDETKVEFKGDDAITGVIDAEKTAVGEKKDVIGVQFLTKAEGAEDPEWSATYEWGDTAGTFADGFAYPADLVVENGVFTYRKVWDAKDPDDADIPDEETATSTVKTGTPAACGKATYTYEPVAVRYEKGASIVYFDINFPAFNVAGQHLYSTYRTWAKSFDVVDPATHDHKGHANAECYCGEKTQIEIPKLDSHTFLKDENDADVVITVPAACTNKGYQYKVCTVEDNGWVPANDDSEEVYYTLEDADGNEVDVIAKTDFVAAVKKAVGEEKAADAKHPVLVAGSVTPQGSHSFVIKEKVKDSDWDTDDEDDITVTVEQFCTVCKDTYDVTYHSASKPETGAVEGDVYSAITSSVTEGADCSVQNTVTYTVNGAPEALSLTEKLATFGPHTYKNSVTFSKDGKTAKVLQQCTNTKCEGEPDIDGNAAVQVVDAEVTSVDNEDGSTTYTASFEGEELGTKTLFDLSKATVTVNGGEVLDVNTIPDYTDLYADAAAAAKDEADKAKQQNEKEAQDAAAAVVMSTYPEYDYTKQQLYYRVYNRDTQADYGRFYFTWNYQDQSAQQQALEDAQELQQVEAAKAKKAVEKQFDYEAFYNASLNYYLEDYGAYDALKDYVEVTINGAVIDPDLYYIAITAPHPGKLVEGSNKISVTADPYSDEVVGGAEGVAKCVVPGTLYTDGVIVDGEDIEDRYSFEVPYDGEDHTFEAYKVFNGDELEVTDATVKYAVVDVTGWDEEDFMEFDPSTLEYGDDPVTVKDAGKYLAFAEVTKEGYTTAYPNFASIEVMPMDLSGKYEISANKQTITYGSNDLVVSTGDEEIDEMIGLEIIIDKLNVGYYDLDEIATYDTNNFVVPFAGGEITVEKRNATVNVSNLTHIYDGTEVAVADAYSIDGVVNGDDLNVVVSVEGGKKPIEPGTYVLVATANNANYNIKTVNGSVIISKAEVPQETKDVVAAAAQITSDKYKPASVKAVADAKAVLDKAIAGGNAEEIAEATAKLKTAVDAANKSGKKAASQISITSSKLKIKRGKKKAIAVSNPAGQKLTFSKVKGNKKISVTADGKIKLKKKGLKKGKTYKVTVQVTAAANDNVLAGTATKKIKVKVK